jgi:hypothetical protein
MSAVREEYGLTVMVVMLLLFQVEKAGIVFSGWNDSKSDET